MIWEAPTEGRRAALTGITASDIQGTPLREQPLLITEGKTSGLGFSGAKALRQLGPTAWAALTHRKCPPGTFKKSLNTTPPTVSEDLRLWAWVISLCYNGRWRNL